MPAEAQTVETDPQATKLDELQTDLDRLNAAVDRKEKHEEEVEALKQEIAEQEARMEWEAREKEQAAFNQRVENAVAAELKRIGAPRHARSMLDMSRFVKDEETGEPRYEIRPGEFLHVRDAVKAEVPMSYSAKPGEPEELSELNFELGEAEREYEEWTDKYYQSPRSLSVIDKRNRAKKRVDALRSEIRDKREAMKPPKPAKKVDMKKVGEIKRLKAEIARERETYDQTRNDRVLAKISRLNGQLQRLQREVV